MISDSVRQIFLVQNQSQAHWSLVHVHVVGESNNEIVHFDIYDPCFQLNNKQIKKVGFKAKGQLLKYAGVFGAQRWVSLTNHKACARQMVSLLPCSHRTQTDNAPRNVRSRWTTTAVVPRPLNTLYN
jgi:hypothetical protein